MSLEEQADKFDVGVADELVQCLLGRPGPTVAPIPIADFPLSWLLFRHQNKSLRVAQLAGSSRPRGLSAAP